MLRILPSLASADQMHLAEEIERVKFLNYMHFDIEDGNFVPNITFGMKTARQARALLGNVQCDAHLMVTDPESYIDDLADMGFRAVAFHWEAAPYPVRLIQKIHSRHMYAGIAINPRTPVQAVENYLPRADYLLIMSSEPDLAGEQFHMETLHKIRHLRRVLIHLPIIVDGGVNSSNLDKLKAAGCDTVVLGRAIFQSKDPRRLVAELQTI